MKRLIFPFFSGLFFTFSIRSASKGDYIGAKKNLDVSDWFGNVIYSHLLLRGHILFSLGDFDGCKSSMEGAIEKINNHQKLNFDEKKYLSLYAVDLINASIVHAGLEEELISVDIDFNVCNVEDRLRENFPLMR
ncbi:MAG: hypothetical protein MK185_01070 [Saccharospirillaceae bacterium]|nr:hypothetical protein [Saccharospirillaceae bacterium]